MKILQLNMYHGLYLAEIIAFVKAHDFDIIHFQEASRAKRWGDMNILSDIRRALDYTVVFQRSWKFVSEEKSYFGNATLYKPSLTLLKKDHIFMKEFEEVTFLEDGKAEHLPRSALSMLFEWKGKQFYAINTHMAWGITPHDADYKKEQAEKLLTYINSLAKPFVLTGDFNLVPHTEIIHKFNLLARNLTVEHHIENTLNPGTHRAKHLFPKGLTVDYIFVSDSIEVKDFKLIDTVDLSDHYGLTAEIALN